MFEDIKNGNIEGVKLAIANGSDVNAKDEFGSTPLDGAVYDGHREIAELLIANGANANAKDEDGATPLHLAADTCLLYTSPSPRDRQKSRMPSSA